MTRFTDAPLKAALLAQRGTFALFLRLAFSTTTFRYTDLPLGSGDTVAWAPPGESSQTWANPGGPITPEPFGEVADLAAAQLRVRLSAIDQTLVAATLNEAYVNRALALWVVECDPDTQQLIDPGMLVFHGLMNGGWELEEVRPEDGPATVWARVTAVSRVIELEETRGIVTSPHVHQRYFSGDRFFEHIPTFGNRKLLWKA
jgi:hypothetical protein